MNKNFIGALLVSMAATSVIAADAPAKKADAKAEVKVENSCQNNACKGKADCMGYGNTSCKGKNTCKGQGHKAAKTEAECVKANGKWTAAKK